MHLEVHQVNVSRSIYQTHLDGLKTQNLQYHITRELCVTDAIAQGSYRKSWTQVFPTSQLLKLIVMTMVRSDAFTGAAKYNPFNFQHFGVNYIQLKVNSKAVPNNDAYCPTWTNLKFMHEYKTLENVCTGEHGISPIQSANGHFFHGLELVPRLTYKWHS